MFSQFGSHALPDVQGSYHVRLRYADDYQPIDKGDGVMVSSGTARLRIEQASIEVTFRFTDKWLLAHSYAGGYAGMKTALIDFSKNVLAGGLQTLTDTLPSGTLDGATPVTSQTVRCRAFADVDREEMVGAPVTEITVQFLCDQPFWTLNPTGTRIPLI
jgi:hypothetical protein